MIITVISSPQAQDSDRETTFDYILPACARISKALGAQFEPFLPTVMDPLLKGAVQTIEFSMVDVDDEDADDDVSITFENYYPLIVIIESLS